MSGRLRCGFCQRDWPECEEDPCPDRVIVVGFAFLLGHQPTEQERRMLNLPSEK